MQFPQRFPAGAGSRIVGAGYCNGRILCFTQPNSGELIPACWHVDPAQGSTQAVHQVSAHVTASAGQNMKPLPGTALIKILETAGKVETLCGCLGVDLFCLPTLLFTTCLAVCVCRSGSNLGQLVHRQI